MAVAVALLLAANPRLQSASIRVQEAWFCWGQGRGSLLHLRCEDERASGQTTSLGFLFSLVTVLLDATGP